MGEKGVARYLGGLYTMLTSREDGFNAPAEIREILRLEVSRKR